ncbi:MAG: hypothetical protein E7347_06510 [Clostridiales bacterium]|nr:hypothetical protein [Clostridiales bacterium]
MEKLEREQTEATAQPAEAEVILGEKDEQVSLGKFKDITALLSAYNSLQAEFTKRCQRIKELEKTLVSDKESTPEQPSEKEQKADITDKDKEEILRKYLQGVLMRKQSAVILDGVGAGVKTPVSKPKTITQAGQLARELLEKKL